ncbi:hypothetical protein M092_1162 [Parabacteroides distasonis str. 3776 D15 iv]|uniref:Uncharacterized protein n=1 Tax=Parabacteroides distasonis str. 3776 D15 i TaxID=1339342 RepID=A0AB34LIG6_PARDI|nr:hypothetical protein M091_4521 [Parabacteroides distasonis str. 3776 D15 i]KDS45211.1 hypothetical protein M090_4222 [Parabacteroides distasonis str. 3776 Po2 i]KDS72409.1 hypothetical protein M092_1162 [Parabacteroides distasonis str. 3776 D15 iv]
MCLAASGRSDNTDDNWFHSLSTEKLTVSPDILFFNVIITV